MLKTVLLQKCFFCVHESVTHTKRLRTIPVSCVAIGVFRSSFMLLSYCLLHLILLRMMFVSGHDGLQLAWFTAVSSDTHSAVTSDRSTRFIHVRHTPTGLHNNWQKSAAYLSCEL